MIECASDSLPSGLDTSALIFISLCFGSHQSLANQTFSFLHNGLIVSPISCIAHTVSPNPCSWRCGPDAIPSAVEQRINTPFPFTRKQGPAFPSHCAGNQPSDPVWSREEKVLLTALQVLHLQQHYEASFESQGFTLLSSICWSAQHTQVLGLFSSCAEACVGGRCKNVCPTPPKEETRVLHLSKWRTDGNTASVAARAQIGAGSLNVASVKAVRMTDVSLLQEQTTQPCGWQKQPQPNWSGEVQISGNNQKSGVGVWSLPHTCSPKKPCSHYETSEGGTNSRNKYARARVPHSSPDELLIQGRWWDTSRKGSPKYPPNKYTGRCQLWGGSIAEPRFTPSP